MQLVCECSHRESNERPSLRRRLPSSARQDKVESGNESCSRHDHIDHHAVGVLLRMWLDACLARLAEGEEAGSQSLDQ